jgi:hypothetical protein
MEDDNGKEMGGFITGGETRRAIQLVALAT